MRAVRFLVCISVAGPFMAACGGGGDDVGAVSQTAVAPGSTPTALHDIAGARTAGATESPANRTYTVQDGDTLSAIAAQFNTTVAILTELNSLENSNNITVGQELKLP